MPARFVSTPFTVPNTAKPASSSSSSLSSSPPTGCGFCKRNREALSVIMSHNLKDASGKITCPQLRKYRCPGCGSTGDEAHTRSYCPQLTGVRQQSQARAAQSGASGGSGLGFRPFMPTTSATFLGNQRLPLMAPSSSFSQHRSVAPGPSHGPSGSFNFRPTATNGQNYQSDHNRYRHIGQPQKNTHQHHQQLQQQQQQQQHPHQLFGTSGTSATQAPARHQVSPPRVGGGSSSDSDDIHLGRSQALNNMSKVTNSRYNSAGRLRHRSSRNRNNQGGQWSFNPSQ